MNSISNKELRWGKQLLKDYKSICYYHGVALEVPNINISEGKSIVGLWQPRSRTISISRHLIEDHAWTVVIEVLKHEMAHQYVTEILSSNDRHGPLFKEACLKLGVHPDFVKTTGAIPTELLDRENELTSPAKVLIDKVEKLFALAQSDNEHEAQLASKKAHEMIHKHNLNIYGNENFEGVERVSYIVMTHKKKQIQSIEKSLLSIIHEFYFVDTVTSWSFDPDEMDSYRVLFLFGTKENLLVAEYVFKYLFNVAERLWQENRQKYGYIRRDKISFDMGFTKGIRENLKKETAPKMCSDGNKNVPVLTQKELTSVINQHIQKEVNRVFPKLKNYYYGSHNGGSAYKQGYQEGKKTIIKKGIHEKKEGKRFLLEC